MAWTGKRDFEAEQLTAALVQIDSSDPGAYEGEIGRFVRKWLEERVVAAGASELVAFDEVEALPGRRCLRAVLGPCASDSPADLTFLCHMDTVTLGEGWSDGTPALGAVVHDGELYGRGSCDMKGGLACAMLAFADAARAAQAAAQDGSLGSGSLALVCTVDEEAEMRGVEAALAAGWLGKRGWVLDTEPTDGFARGSHKGRTWFELVVDGTTAHASTPWRGADAVAGMSEAVSFLRRSFAALPAHEELGCSTITFGQIEGGYQPYVVPDHCRCWIDMRLVPPTDSDAARKLVEQALCAAEEAVPGVRGRYVVTGDRPAIELPATSRLLSALQDAVADACGEPCGVSTFTGYTDTAVVAGTCGNSECLSYGPGSLEVAHKPNEHVPLADLARVRAVLRKLALGHVAPAGRP